MTPIRALIFDMDGVLADTEPMYVDLNGRFLADRGIPLVEVGYEQYVGISAVTMWSQIRRQFGLSESVEWLMKRERDDFFHHLEDLDYLAPIPGVEKVLQEGRSRNLAIGLASSSARPNIDLILSKTGLTPYFQAITSGYEVGNGKPAPDIFLLAAQRLGCSPEECLVVEDSTNGVRGAKAAAMACVGFQNPGSGSQDLRQADLVVPDFQEPSRQRVWSAFSW